MRTIEVENSKAFLAELLDALDSGEEFTLSRGGEPEGRYTPVSQVVAKSEEYFTHYPHEASECLHTCWRHPRIPAEVSPE